MIRGLAFIAVGGALASALCFGVAGSCGPINFTLADIEWNPEPSSTARGPQTTRTLPWQASNELTVNIAGKLIVKQGNDASITVAGPQKIIDDIALNGNSLDFSKHHHKLRGSKLVVTVTAPALNTLTLNSFSSVELDNYTQKTLDLTINGAASVKGTGSVDYAKLVVNGAASVDLAAMEMRELDVEMDGAASIKAGPTNKAKITIDGAGSVKLTTHPAQLSKQINGAGSISMTDGPPTPPRPDQSTSPEKPDKQTEDDSSF